MLVQLGKLVFDPTLYFHPRIATAAWSRGPVDLLTFVDGECLSWIARAVDFCY